MPIKELKTVNEIFASRLLEAPAQKTIDHKGNVNSFAGYGVDGFDLILQPSMDIFGAQNTQWWEACDNYIDTYPGGVK